MNQEIARILIGWYEKNRRELPWRETADPYCIWISEVILQQTRVAQGLGYYHRFMDQFPDVLALARADEDEVMRCWQGLGYYSRARNLHAAAKEIATRWGGEFPSSHEEVRGLKGIGDYTAAAICSIAWRQPYAVVDGNVYRVLSRCFGIDTPIDSGEGKRAFARLAQELLDRERPDLYNQAIMDFGAMQCVPRLPDCSACPLAGKCVAYSRGLTESLPVKQGKTVVKPRYFNYLHIRCNGLTLLNQRTGKDIWQNLYEYPLIETPHPEDFSGLSVLPEYRRLMEGVKEIRMIRTVEMPRHVLSHRVIHACFHVMEVSNISEVMCHYFAVPDGELDRCAVPRLIDLYREKTGSQKRG